MLHHILLILIFRENVSALCKVFFAFSSFFWSLCIHLHCDHVWVVLLLFALVLAKQWSHLNVSHLCHSNRGFASVGITSVLYDDLCSTLDFVSSWMVLLMCITLFFLALCSHFFQTIFQPLSKRYCHILQSISLIVILRSMYVSTVKYSAVNNRCYNTRSQMIMPWFFGQYFPLQR